MIGVHLAVQQVHTRHFHRFDNCINHSLVAAIGKIRNTLNDSGRHSLKSIASESADAQDCEPGLCRAVATPDSPVARIGPTQEDEKWRYIQTCEEPAPPGADDSSPAWFGAFFAPNPMLGLRYRYRQVPLGTAES